MELNPPTLDIIHYIKKVVNVIVRFNEFIYTKSPVSCVYINKVLVFTFMADYIGLLLNGILVAFVHWLGKMLAEVNLYSAS